MSTLTITIYFRFSSGMKHLEGVESERCRTLPARSRCAAQAVTQCPRGAENQHASAALLPARTAWGCITTQQIDSCVGMHPTASTNGRSVSVVSH